MSERIGCAVPDLDEATRFLNILDPNGRFTFQTFHDALHPTKPLARVIHPPARAALLQLHAQGAGVYVTVNETDGCGRKLHNIKRIRTVWQEADSGYNGPFPLQPSMTVESSPAHYHRYWLVADEWLTDKQGCADFAGVMQRIVRDYGSDPGAKDISRVLRIPGFLHRKAKPLVVKLIDSNGAQYSKESILKAFPRIAPEQRLESKPIHSVSISPDKRLSGLIRFVASAPEHHRNKSLYWAGCRIKEMADAGQIAGAIGKAVLVEAASRCGLSQHEASNTVNSAFKRKK
jgi:hypothetical protein